MSKCQPSATLILARQHEENLQVYLLRRNQSSRFMPGTWVFPGGNLDAADRDLQFWRKRVDLPHDSLTGTLGGAPDRLLPYAVAAIRETWEEAGLLLAGPEKSPTADLPGPLSNTIFRDHLIARELTLAISRLGRWHHWITPKAMPRRYETYFFVASVSVDAVCRPDLAEVEEGCWIEPRRALVANHRKTISLSPPTLVTLHQLLDFPNLQALMAVARKRPWSPSILPRLQPLDEGVLIVEPWDPDYHKSRIRVDETRLEDRILPVGAPFSRLWRAGGHCRPVR